MWLSTVLGCSETSSSIRYDTSTHYLTKGSVDCFAFVLDEKVAESYLYDSN